MQPIPATFGAYRLIESYFSFLIKNFLNEYNIIRKELIKIFIFSFFINIYFINC